MHFSKENVEMAKRHMKRRSTSLIIREREIKTAVKYHLIWVRMTIIIKSTNRCGENRTLLWFWQECKLIQPLWRTVRRFFKKVKVELPFDPAIPQ